MCNLYEIEGWRALNAMFLDAIHFILAIFCRHCSLLMFCILPGLSSCAWHPCTPEYHALYGHLEAPPKSDDIQPPLRYLVLLAAARHLDYTNGRQLLKTIARHPSDGGKNSDVGHAWIMLAGENGILEGGHTGEFGVMQPRYFEGVAELIQEKDPNPVRYLWATQKDGVFQKGAAGFIPTFAALVKLDERQYQKVRKFILSGRYPFQDYAITKNQCAAFAAQAAKLAGLELNHSITVPIEQFVRLGNENVMLWSDSCYSQLTISTPDILEKSLMQAVKEKKAQNATSWYKKKFAKKKNLGKQLNAILMFPSRYARYRLMSEIEEL